MTDTVVPGKQLGKNVSLKHSTCLQAAKTNWQVTVGAGCIGTKSRREEYLVVIIIQRDRLREIEIARKR